MSNLKKPEKPINPNRRDIRVNARVNTREMAVIMSWAIKYTKGDLSGWIRYAALNFKPGKKDLVK